ncbi:type IV toxin-antitoxin system AbiEi family antitoxin [Kocuria marina]|uniref:type IV toxin-antitoxin system AbiEi family antitoxin n=1 Tax=Kocuria marina TaxID=223184 RepID=UPI0022E3BD7C|nr:type IV toxin-antitoxin system AbiEi family antitoxin [Kocuria marina]
MTPVFTAPGTTAPLVLLPGHPFSRAELSAMAEDGLLRRELLDAYVPATAAPTLQLRATAVSRVVPGHLQRRGVLGRLGAAWFYRCAPEPSPVTILVDKSARTTTTVPPGLVIHQTGFAPRDLVVHHGITLTTPLRTGVDLAVHVTGPAGDAALLALLSAPRLHCSPQQLLAELEALAKLPGRRVAIARVRKLARALEPGRAGGPVRS